MCRAWRKKSYFRPCQDQDFKDQVASSEETQQWNVKSGMEIYPQSKVGSKVRPSGP